MAKKSPLYPPTQIDIVSTLLQMLPDESVAARVFNAAIKAANEFLAEYEQPYRPAVPGMGLFNWLRCDDTGQSSQFMAFVLSQQIGHHLSITNLKPLEKPHPHDPADFGRCVGLLDAEPSLREHLPLMADRGGVWHALVADWVDLEAIYRDELPSGNAPKLFARLRELIARVIAEEPT